MKILFATGNEHKVTEAAALLGPLGHNVKALIVDGASPGLVEPQADGLEEVALAKIEQARSMGSASWAETMSPVSTISIALP